MKGLLAPATTIGINMCCCCLNSVRGVVRCYNLKYAEGTWERCCRMSSTSPSSLQSGRLELATRKTGFNQSSLVAPWVTVLTTNPNILGCVTSLFSQSIVSCPFSFSPRGTWLKSDHQRETNHHSFRSYLGGTDSSVTAICSAIICTHINTRPLSGSDIWIQFACMEIWLFCHISQRCSLC